MNAEAAVVEADAASRAGLLEGQLFCGVRTVCRRRMKQKEMFNVFGVRSRLDLASSRTACDAVSLIRKGFEGIHGCVNFEQWAV